MKGCGTTKITAISQFNMTDKNKVIPLAAIENMYEKKYGVKRHKGYFADKARQNKIFGAFLKDKIWGKKSQWFITVENAENFIKKSPPARIVRGKISSNNLIGLPKMAELFKKKHNLSFSKSYLSILAKKGKLAGAFKINPKDLKSSWLIPEETAYNFINNYVVGKSGKRRSGYKKIKTTKG